MDDEEANELNEKMQMQYDFGSFVKDELVPNAVKYYTGEAIEDEESYDDEDEEVVTHVPSLLCARFDVECRVRTTTASMTTRRKMTRKRLLHPKAARSKASRGLPLLYRGINGRYIAMLFSCAFADILFQAVASAVYPRVLQASPNASSSNCFKVIAQQSNESRCSKIVLLHRVLLYFAVFATS